MARLCMQTMCVKILMKQNTVSIFILPFVVNRMSDAKINLKEFCRITNDQSIILFVKKMLFFFANVKQKTYVVLY